MGLPGNKAIYEALMIAHQAIYHQPRQALDALMRVAAVLEQSTPVQGTTRYPR